jgi:antitoxin (DNA-binding transcriptional repressor) of toxin-antitoxin stability system
MHYSPSVTEVARNFAEYVNRVAFRGERFVLMRGRRAVAELRPVPAGRRLGDLPQLLASLPRLGPEDAAALENDLAIAREQIRDLPENDAWES